MTTPEYSPKKNFASGPKPNFDNVNCSGDQTRVSSTRPVSGLGKGRTGERKSGKLVYTKQVHNLVFRALCQGFETKHSTKVKERTIRKRRKAKKNETQEKMTKL